ncbi:Asp/Glu/hydantoin racemase [Methylobacterium sp. 4-46]|uniref:aspartate/glutamate racemase family protein n=1 Tax=unclassified Methylobacterium TaxID=2615210 RepID=UPI000152DB2C|nr:MULTISPECIES: aspartate/glutamate racemase family protein [Methylobacterium]ACA19607.1 Asp/Glu/hydantoin racemase [Methylobacterium sp. 4-46]WFT78801.1 aspartate/glutamate racemase family protein [Methylobacterium nodulans]
MRLLLINANTTEAVTDLVAGVVRRLAPEVEIVAATGRFGGRYVATRATAAIAAHAALDALAEHGGGCDAVYLACFGDPGLLALKEVSPAPVIGMAEGALHLACTRGRRVGIVTGGAAWRPMLQEFAASLGLSERIAGIRTVAPTGGEIARDPDAALAGLAAACRACAAEDGADVVVLGGAALAGLAARLQPDVPVPLICSTEAGARMALAAAALRTGRTLPAASESVGLSAALADLLARPR